MISSTLAVVKRDKMVATSFDIALRNYTRSHQQGDYYDRIINLATALEAILTGSDDETEGVGLRLRTRAAALLWTDTDPGRAIFDDVKTPLQPAVADSSTVPGSPRRICSSG